jgi:hypothetical protein
MKSHLFLALLLVLALNGCSTLQEDLQEYDLVLGPDYLPPIEKINEELPTRILFCPMFVNVSPQYAEVFMNEFRSQFNGLELILPNAWKNRTNLPSRGEVMKYAGQFNCDGMLLVTLHHPSFYPPIRTTVDIALQRLEDNLVIWKGIADYDSKNKLVCTSARRYAKKVLGHADQPTKSEYILKNNNSFIQFTAWHLAKFLNNLAKPAEIPQEIPPDQAVKD